MFDVFKAFRICGILPYRIKRNKLVLCPHWHLYSRMFAFLAFLITSYRGVIYIRNTDFVNILSVSCIFQYILQWEPMFLFFHICIIFSTVFNKKNTQKSIKILELLFEVRQKGVGRIITYYTFCNFVLLFILILVLHNLNTQYHRNVTIMHLLDYIVGYISSVVVSLQILQFCVYFEIVLKPFSELESCVTKRPKLFKTFVKIFKLKIIIRKFEDIYYWNIILIQLNLFIYCIFGIRGIYDFIGQRYDSIFIVIILEYWMTFYLPLLLYLMHLSEKMENKVNF